ncbi:hypothetical protein W97_04621 [Coniosporium apollinis CBS 100218]|uniref:Uncharacterized protein n=1 Tax=Coniosporium apollinis (strain CBS 100218) TaxID=1168221 RepID=R7YU56_CONA1|nr:uncharacterized protein W97_04621 [Coniosporium apollinis CBS 100218]EON65383.1 hypothetical protein W97_04621 [Coniosporium apollinis CBS 100218]
MHFRVAVTLLNLALFAAATPFRSRSVTVINTCPYNIFLWSVGDRQGARVTLVPGAAWSEAYYKKADGSGPSIKLSTNPHDEGDLQNDIYQVEYTVHDDGRIQYDMSAVNCYSHNPWGCPFVHEGTKLEIDNPTCKGFECRPGDVHCRQSYLAPKHDHANRGCPSGGALTFTACSG